MRKIFFLVFILILGQGLKINAQKSEVNYHDPETWILGYFDSDRFLAEPHQVWYNKGFDDYDLDSEAFMELSELDLKDIEVLIVLATWCPDSRREVPRFMKITELVGLNEERIKLLGTDSNKVAPIDGYDVLNIERVPTFIFYRNKKEIGRIIEYPKASLERDIVNILGAEN